jgi:hypothetical protein
MFTSAAGCARDSQAVPVRPSVIVATAPTPEPSAPPAKAAPRPDVVDKDACQLARAELKRQEQQAAAGCKLDTDCVLDADCLPRARNADTAPIKEARMEMEATCARQPVERLSCVEAPARCASGRCVAPAEAP